MGVLSFGGPAAQIGILHRILIDEKRWISEKRFQHALNFCMLLPGPEATQLATYVGWLLYGIRGGLLAAFLFIAPGALVMLGLSIAYVLYGDLTPAEGILLGLKSATIAIVLASLRRLTKRTIKTPAALALAVGVLIANGVFKIGFPWLVAFGALAGLLLGRHITGKETDEPTGERALSLLDDASERGPRPCWRRASFLALAGIAIWWLPVLAIVALDKDSVFAAVGLTFSKASLVTFGGAYAVLGYIREQFVDVHQWLSAKDMISGLALAEAKPGPLILVGQFVSFVAGAGSPGPWPRLLAGAIASCVFLWASFVPCLMWIFVFGPYVELARHNKRLTSMLAGISAVVVGVIATLSIWLIVHTVFERVGSTSIAGLSVDMPDLTSIRWSVVVIALASGIALQRFKLGVGLVLVLSLVAGLAWMGIRVLIKAP
jgi:chromate transporter